MGQTLTSERTIPCQREPFMGVRAPVSQGTAAERLSVAVRKHVGRGRAYSIEQFRQKIGASASAVEKMMAGEYMPGLPTLLTMQRELPPQFANDLIELAGLTGARRLAGIETSAAVLAADLADETALVVRALSDGCIDHQERAVLRTSLSRLAVEIQEFTARLGA